MYKAGIIGLAHDGERSTGGMKSNMQEGRLFKIVYHLLEKGQATAPELAERFEVSVRTIYRDIDALSEAGIPVYAETGRNGGIHLLQGFVLDKAVLSEKEKQEILTALQSLSVVGNACENDTLQKLSALFQIHMENWCEADFSRWGNKSGDNEKFELLKIAILGHQSVRMVYVGAYMYTACNEKGSRTNAEAERIVYPMKLLYKSRAWYLQAYCTERQAFRTFKLNRIIKLELLEEKFVPVPVPKPEAVPEQLYNQIKLRFSKEMAYRVYDEFDAAEISREENGDLLVAACMPEDEWLIGFLLSFGAQVEVMEPVYLREILAEKAKEIYEKNKA